MTDYIRALFEENDAACAEGGGAAAQILALLGRSAAALPPRTAVSAAGTENLAARGVAIGMPDGDAIPPGWGGETRPALPAEAAAETEDGARRGTLRGAAGLYARVRRAQAAAERSETVPAAPAETPRGRAGTLSPDEVSDWFRRDARRYGAARAEFR